MNRKFCMPFSYSLSVWSVNPQLKHLRTLRWWHYCKTVGSLRYLNIIPVRPVLDPHEIFFHLLDVIAVDVSKVSHSIFTLSFHLIHSFQGMQSYRKAVLLSHTKRNKIVCHSSVRWTAFIHIRRQQSGVANYLLGRPSLYRKTTAAAGGDTCDTDCV